MAGATELELRPLVDEVNADMMLMMAMAMLTMVPMVLIPLVGEVNTTRANEFVQGLLASMGHGAWQ